MRKLDAAALALSMSLAGNGCSGENPLGNSAEIENIREQTQALNSYGQLQSAPFANPNANEVEPSFLPGNGKYDHKILFVSDRLGAPKKMDILSTKFDGVNYSTPQAVVGLNDPSLNEIDPLICAPLDGCPTPKILFNSNPGGPTKSKVRDFIEGDGANPDSAPANTEVFLGNNINTLGTFFRPSAIHNGYVYGGWDPNGDYNIARFKVSEMLNNPKPELVKGADDPSLDEEHISFNGDGTVLLTTSPWAANQEEISECEFDEVNVAVQNCQKVPYMSGNPASQAAASHITGTNIVVSDDSNTPNSKPQIKFATITFPQPDGGAPDGGISDAGADSGVDAGQDAGAPDSGAQDGGVDGGSQDAGVGGAGGAAPDGGIGGQSPDGGAAGAGGKGQGGAGGIGGGLNTGGHAGQGGMGTGGSPDGGSAGGPAEDGGAGGSTPDSGAEDGGSDAETPCSTLENGTIVDNLKNIKITSCEKDGSFVIEVLGPVKITTIDNKNTEIVGITQGADNTLTYKSPNGFTPGKGLILAGFHQDESQDSKTKFEVPFLGQYLGADATGWEIGSRASSFVKAVENGRMTKEQADQTSKNLSALYANQNGQFAAVFMSQGTAKFCEQPAVNCTELPEHSTYYVKINGDKAESGSFDPADFNKVPVSPVQADAPKQPGGCACEIGAGSDRWMDVNSGRTAVGALALAALALGARRKNEPKVQVEKEAA
jgi:hypothetical protein